MKLFLPILLLIAPYASATEQPEKKPTAGKHVTLRYGPGFSKLSAMVIRDRIIKQGCPAVLQEDGLFDNAIDVEIGENWETFESPGSAESYALTVCKE